MPAQPLRKDESSNPQTAEAARAFVKHVELLFMPWNIDALVDGFTEDCVVRFGTVSEFRGREFFAHILYDAQLQANGLSTRKTISVVDERYDRQCLEGRMARRRYRCRHARLWRRDLGDARRQDCDLGSGVQLGPRRSGQQRDRSAALTPSRLRDGAYAARLRSSGSSDTANRSVPRSTSAATFFPIFSPVSARIRSSAPVMATPSSASRMSPACSPARSAALPVSIVPTITALSCIRPARRNRRGIIICCAEMPIKARRTRP